MMKAARKKGAKKSAKKSARKKKAKVARCTYTVKMTDSSVKPKKVKLKSGETVRWRNVGTESRKITFKKGWPFGGRKTSFTVRPGRFTKCYPAKSNKSPVKCSYRVQPFPGPPNGPAVDYEG